MNWNKFILVGGITLALAAAVPAANAQRGSRGAARSHSASFGARSFHAPAGGNARLTAARSTNFRGGTNWGNHDHWGHRRGRHYHGFYPYYGYYPYGYPFWGTSFYFGNDEPVYQARGSGSLISDVQQQLTQAGYYRGEIDGVLGNETRRAIRLYERAHGLPVDGRLDENLLGAMGLG